jgi:hypothetical protein
MSIGHEPDGHGQGSMAYQPGKTLICKVSREARHSARAAKPKVKVAEILGGAPLRIGGERKPGIWRGGTASCYQLWREYFL